MCPPSAVQLRVVHSTPFTTAENASGFTDQRHDLVRVRRAVPIWTVLAASRVIGRVDLTHRRRAVDAENVVIVISREPDVIVCKTALLIFSACEPDRCSPACVKEGAPLNVCMLCHTLGS